MAFASTCIFSIFIIWVVAIANGDSHHHHPAAVPAPTAVDCSSVVLNMADCLSYVSNGSTTTKPEKSCCTGLKTVLQTDARCLCEAFKSSAQLGVVLNVTKALSLPSACNLHAPPLSACGLALSPAGAPGLSPASGPSSPGFPGPNQQAPSPSPGKGAADGLTASVGSAVIAFLIVSFSIF